MLLIIILILLLVIASLTMKGVALGIAIGLLGGAILIIVGLFIYMIVIWASLFGDRH